MGRLQGKVAIITGAAMGMGEADARLFASEGAKVVATDISVEKLRAVVSEINATGGDAIALELDVSSEADWAKVVANTIELYGTIDILINNAGILTCKDLEHCTLDNWNKVQSINSTGVFLGMKSVIPEMKKNRKGSIVNISSIAGLTGSVFATAGDVAYCASKWAVRGMSKQVANTYASFNIRVNSLHPGPTNTPLFQAADEPEGGWAPILSQVVPLPPYQTQPIMQAYAALYLASDEASFITGIELPCDGGFSSH